MSVFSNQMNSNNDILDQLEETCISMLDSLGMLDIDESYGAHGVKDKVKSLPTYKKLEKRKDDLKREWIDSFGTKDSNKSHREYASARDTLHGYERHINRKMDDIKYSHDRLAEKKPGKYKTSEGLSANYSPADAKFNRNHKVTPVRITPHTSKVTPKRVSQNSSFYDDSYSQADFIREACYTILATLDELE